MVFHDSLDYRNLYDFTADPEEGRDLDDHGGVDGCLHMPLAHDGLPDGNHNRNLPSLKKWKQQLGKHLKRKGKNGGYPLLRKISDPDLAVLGALAAIEAQGAGPKVPMLFGRRKGKCEKK